MNRLWVKLTFAFLAIALAAIGVVAVMASRATASQFRQYVVAAGMMSEPSAEVLTAYYRANGSWVGVGQVLAELGPGGMGMGMGRGRGATGMAGPNLAVADADGRVVASRTGELTGEFLPADVLAQGIPLIVNGQRVGALLNVRPAEEILNPEGEAFLSAVRRSLIYAGLLATVLSLALGVLISRLLTAPLSRLTHAAQAISEGDLTQRVAVRSSDEIGQLSVAFNDMSASLATAETLRRNLIADISHELRTPLTVVQGNLQALLDGVYPLEMAQVAGIYDETRLLTRLVDDLHDLALAEAGQLRLERAPVDVVALVRSTVNQFAPVADAACVVLDLEASEPIPSIRGDADRLAQVLRNLLSNALRHTPEGGRVNVSLAVLDAVVRIEVADTGPGISSVDLPHVFDRFYRGDRSRSRRSGGAGLGLAIARQLVTAHDGALEAASPPGEGAVFTVTLPV